LTVKSPLVLCIHHALSVLPSLRMGLMFIVICCTISSEITDLSLSSFHSSFMIKSFTSNSSSCASSPSVKYNAPCLVQLSNQKLEFPALICHHISCSTSSLILIIFFQTCEAPELFTISGCIFLQYLFHMYSAHKEFMDTLKFHQSLANKALFIS